MLWKMQKFLDKIKDGFTSNAYGDSRGLVYLQPGFPFWWDDQVKADLLHYKCVIWRMWYDFCVHYSGLSADMEIEP